MSRSRRRSKRSRRRSRRSRKFRSANWSRVRDAILSAKYKKWFDVIEMAKQRRRKDFYTLKTTFQHRGDDWMNDLSNLSKSEFIQRYTLQDPKLLDFLMLDYEIDVIRKIIRDVMHYIEVHSKLKSPPGFEFPRELKEWVKNDIISSHRKMIKSLNASFRGTHPDGFLIALVVTIAAPGAVTLKVVLWLIWVLMAYFLDDNMRLIRYVHENRSEIADRVGQTREYSAK